MQYKVVFYDVTAKWEDEFTSSSPLSCEEAAMLALERKGKKDMTLEDAVFCMDDRRVQTDTVLADGACLYVFRLMCGG